MALRSILFGIIAWCFTLSAACAEEVVYCIDTDATGFKWDEHGQAAPQQFARDRYTIRILSDTDRIISRMDGDRAGVGYRYVCRRPYSDKEQIVCDDSSGFEPWSFHGNSYTYSFLAGPPAGGSSPNLIIGYGVCTKF
ncbi:MAG: hypothetical protein WAL80_13905 [Xanthobacteraceae bacterium]|jgi:hypothetical protein